MERRGAREATSGRKALRLDQVVVPRDAVVGVPVEYGETVLDNTISLLATITTSDELVAAWS